jgi:glycosyltransferase involved in cell wall biosynthesis
MKIAVATIAKNEQQFVTRWAESCADADYRLILDTGSTDKTLHEIILNDTIAWEQKEFTPWRFDTARNYALSRIPEDIDYVIWLDMDEVLQPGWREALETTPVGITRPRYKYVWSWNPDGTEGLTYGGDKIHTRHGYTWKHPVHETLKPVGIIETQHFVDGLEIHHHPDPTKSRSQYLPLLKMAVDEAPTDDRNQFYLAREYFFQGEHALAQYHFMRHLDLSIWPPERAASHRYIAKTRRDAKEFHLYRAIAEDPTRRESWYALASHYHTVEDWTALRFACEMGYRTTVKPLDYLCESDAWGWQFHDLFALAYHHTGDPEKALWHGATAFNLNPTDERLKNNLKWYSPDRL